MSSLVFLHRDYEFYKKCLIFVFKYTHLSEDRMSKNEKYVIGVDLGGTKIYATVVDQSGKILGSARKKTKAELGFDGVVSRIAKCVREVVAKVDIDYDTIWINQFFYGK